MTVPASIKSALQVFTDGSVQAKIGASGFALIGAAISDTVTGILFAAVCSLWFLDMALGVVRAVAEDQFEIRDFFEGFGKAIAAAGGIGVAVVIDSLGAGIVDAYTGTLAAAAAMGGIVIAFGASAIENFGFWFPQVASKLRGFLHASAEPPPAEWYTMDPEARTRVMQAFRAEDAEAKRGTQ